MSTEFEPVCIVQSEFTAEAVLLMADVSTDVLLCHLSLAAAFEDRSGVRLCKELRCEHGYSGAIVFFGAESRSAVFQEKSIVGSDVPGSEYLELPALVEEMGHVLAQSRQLTAEELESVAFRFGVREDIGNLIHRINNSLQGKDQEGAQSGMNALIALAERYQLTEALKLCERAGRDIIRAFDECSEVPIGRIARTLETLQNSICSEREVSVLEFDVPDLPPEGFCSVLIGDDSPYSPMYLKQKGYDPVYVVSTPDEAEDALRINTPDVFICDYSFPTATEGCRLMALAKETFGVKLVVAMSGSRLDPVEVPHSDVSLSGWKEDADRIHALIWKGARAQGRWGE